ncbi:MAG: phosphate acetyltransferase [Spiribacter sp.]|nr:phosphate acetyltransferase [Spiribacter sp.]MDR9490197.1 phosphate acetyltransferase [Spiribacter sp.]
MTLLDELSARARGLSARIVLSEGSDARVLRAAVMAADDGVAVPLLLGNAEEIYSVAEKQGIALAGIEVVDPSEPADCERRAAALFALRQHKGLTLENASKLASSPLYAAPLMVREAEADGCVGGAVHSTADTVRAALQVIGVKPGNALVSSFFLMIPPVNSAIDSQALIFADCALNVRPNAEELAYIASDTADNANRLLSEPPRVAMLSFSTLGSAKHPDATRVADATHAVEAMHPDLEVDGELQFDASIVADIAERKAPKSTVAGRANIFIFPGLEAGNIGYKIAQRLGGFLAIGPVLQGLARPANDLSRGCSVEDIYRMMVLTALQTEGAKREYAKI